MTTTDNNTWAVSMVWHDDVIRYLQQVEGGFCFFTYDLANAMTMTKEQADETVAWIERMLKRKDRTEKVEAVDISIELSAIEDRLIRDLLDIDPSDTM